MVTGNASMWMILVSIAALSTLDPATICALRQNSLFAICLLNGEIKMMEVGGRRDRARALESSCELNLYLLWTNSGCRPKTSALDIALLST